jgi:DNA-binding transcriptional LysR family regulator
LDLRLVRYFVTVAEELHFGRAATRLHIAQPSLSHQIRRLEQLLGVALLERTSRSVALTPPGRALLREGRRLLAQAERAVSITRAAGADTLVVGFAGSAATGLLTEVVHRFEEAHPTAVVALRELPLDRIDDVLTGRVDVAFTRLLPGQTELEIEVLARESRVAALPAAHPLASRTSLRFEELHNERFITNPLKDAGPPLRWLAEQQRHGLPGRVGAQAASVPEILALIASGRGVCLVPAPVAQHYRHEGVRYVPVTDAEPAVVSLAWAPQTTRPTVRAFVEAAREVARKGTA